MCQYTPRCSVGTHRPGTVCPYATSSPRPTPAWQTPPRHPAPKSVYTSSRDRSAQNGPATVGGVITGADLLALVILIALVSNNAVPVNTAFIVVTIVLLLIPLAVAGWLLSRCRAWNKDGLSRCQRRTKALLGRCGTPGHARSAQWVLLPEAVAVAAFIVLIGDALVLVPIILRSLAQ